MIPFSLSSVASFLHAKLINTDQMINTISIDSRIIGDKCLFVALKGSRFDSHDFVIQAINKGAKALLVNYYLPLNISQLVVSNTRDALGQLGFWVRHQVTTRVIAITGSIGKTSVKEMTYAILCNNGKTIATYGNFNNDIGVSLTLLRLSNQDDFAVIELGTSSFGEIAKTVKLVRPEIALINNISYAHLSAFRSLLGVAQAKGEILSGLPTGYGRCIINADSHNWLLWRDLLHYKLVWRFSLRAMYKVDFFATNIVCNNNGVRFTFHTPQGKCNISLPLLGYHNVANALAAGALAMSVGISLLDISIAFKSVKLLPGRLYPIVLSPYKVLLDDSYNSNIGSMMAAIQVLKVMPGYRVMVVSDMMELGTNREGMMYHSYIGKIIAMSNIDVVLSIGYLSFFLSKASGCGKHFYDRKLLVIYLMRLLMNYEVITVLVKGSRVFAMDNIVKELQETWLCYY
ncbi:UDP-N-acetylmuramoyl-tripeptide--D-alanyl-D-alanine ligase [Blochmannia endosymbiont of Camponotus (Colobopsis) obliquus]|uniref:UDP-N-acetylmuramoyl-tripeptide--D-alanyl-D- alanine ligase n=1 Tax=Blochmannia endosymbiont of Camponotus (Colobopsis) obliquus TaxID=1505597 RepID=UPI00061A7291|nr:UDP-N-acetylmuramoyl-tripeptide--D-alanyl-D-alanine ligase [Blochmannia endosymbiont of Camponotus (Colobopsis) obliquus]AKC60313.1 UDP-N-acetylmuramoyl-tripeptide--D-alanyl-D-alanine ligase [Blochmannia endosymbiont of Camponotus (Colobopsis) obliquus]